MNKKKQFGELFNFSHRYYNPILHSNACCFRHAVLQPALSSQDRLLFCIILYYSPLTCMLFQTCCPPIQTALSYQDQLSFYNPILHSHLMHVVSDMQSSCPPCPFFTESAVLVLFTANVHVVSDMQYSCSSYSLIPESAVFVKCTILFTTNMRVVSDMQSSCPPCPLIPRSAVPNAAPN